MVSISTRGEIFLAGSFKQRILPGLGQAGGQLRRGPLQGQPAGPVGHWGSWWKTQKEEAVDWEAETMFSPTADPLPPSKPLSLQDRAEFALQWATLTQDPPGQFQWDP